MKTCLHHAHLFASDMDRSIRFYEEMFGAEILFDLEMAGARNVMIAIGGGKINFYDQPPGGAARGVVHHLGIETDDLDALVKHMVERGYVFRNSVRDLGFWKYTMAEGPDGILLELFEIVSGKGPEEGYREVSSL